jgi:hypothetical protein
MERGTCLPAPVSEKKVLKASSCRHKSLWSQTAHLQVIYLGNTQAKFPSRIPAATQSSRHESSLVFLGLSEVYARRTVSTISREKRWHGNQHTKAALPLNGGPAGWNSNDETYSSSDGLIAGHLAVGLNAMFQAVKLPAGVSDLSDRQ